ncbi:Lysophospholipase L1 [Granulicella pectinivorans]|uniref:Lysophospholipase L1 n=1 Tax=Granulicella pectinivorans TaxID=474950 RepID=A0A1I6MA58_9BACT|nr:GDSL-type esterase/lipase family protein [Granulicella pectinivorans]SFS12606.1 Lysophospholipase L1 [Granulicella pectinivorans]
MLNPIRVALTTLLFLARVATAQLSTGNPATNPVPRTESWWVARHHDKLTEAQLGNVDLLFVGDSITQNYEKPGPAPNEVFLPIWQTYFAPHRAMNLGFSGDETAHVLWRLQNGEVQGLNPKNIVLLIGTNNTGRGQTAPQVTEGIIACVEELHRLMPAAKILLLNILPTAITELKSSKDATINTNIDAHYASSPYVRTLDLAHLFLKNGVVDPTLFYDPELQPSRAPLHPNTAGQRRMAEAVSHALYPTP